MDFKTYYRKMNREDREAFAERAQTTTGYIENHLVHRRRVPRPDKMELLASASMGECTLQDLVSFFYQST